MTLNSPGLPAFSPRGKPPAVHPRARGPRGLTARIRTLVDDRENQEFLPAHLEILDTPASPYALVFLWVICAMFAVTLAWSCLAKIDIFAVATGRVQPSGRSKVVQPYETSKVQAILTENGAHVSVGQLLITLESTAATADLDSKRADLGSFDAQIARYKATIQAVQTNRPQATPDFPSTIPSVIEAQEKAAMQADIDQYLSTRESLISQLAEKAATQEQYKTSIAARQRLMDVLKERAAMKQTLVNQAAGTRSALMDAMQQVEQASADMAYDQGQFITAQAAYHSLERKMQQLTSETIAKQTQAYAEALEKRATAVQDVIKAGYHREQMQLTSPIDGTVQQIAVNTIGQVVTAGQPLMVIVPSEGPIEIEALVPNKDIGFIVPDQDAVVKIDAFPYTRYGTIDGKVRRVSRDAIDMRDAGGGTDAMSVAKGQSISPANGTPSTQNLVFPVSIELQRSSIMSEGHEVALTPGMTASVEIRTGSRRVIDYVLAPIRETTSTAGHER